MGFPRLNKVTAKDLLICDACIDGDGGECHTPECLLWLCRAPDLPLRDRIEMYGGSITPIQQTAETCLETGSMRIDRDGPEE